MIGDSIVFGWSREGHEVWNEHYGNRNAVNIGSSGDMTSHMLWHMPDALHPNAEGYREWAKAMEPMLTTLLGK
jgi:lysophospholipase L1-like esterase